MVKPFGFTIDDNRLKRAGLDYWQHLSITYYENIEEFFKINKDKTMAFLSSHGSKNHWDIPFEDDMFLVFGKVTLCLSKSIIEKHSVKFLAFDAWYLGCDQAF